MSVKVLNVLEKPQIFDTLLSYSAACPQCGEEATWEHISGLTVQISNSAVEQWYQITCTCSEQVYPPSTDCMIISIQRQHDNGGPGLLDGTASRLLEGPAVAAARESREALARREEEEQRQAAQNRIPFFDDEIEAGIVAGDYYGIPYYGF
jgi:hypothetical protein